MLDLRGIPLVSPHRGSDIVDDRTRSSTSLGQGLEEPEVEAFGVDRHKYIWLELDLVAACFRQFFFFLFRFTHARNLSLSFSLCLSLSPSHFSSPVCIDVSIVCTFPFCHKGTISFSPSPSPAIRVELTIAASASFSLPNSLGIYGTTSNRPITDKSDIGNTSSSPSPFIAVPPTPENLTWVCCEGKSRPASYTRTSCCCHQNMLMCLIMVLDIGRAELHVMNEWVSR